MTITNGKVAQIRTEYVNFDDVTFGNNRTKLLAYIKEYHPELNGFINDQTEAGGKNYLKALEYYHNRN